MFTSDSNVVRYGTQYRDYKNRTFYDSAQNGQYVVPVFFFRVFMGVLVVEGSLRRTYLIDVSHRGLLDLLLRTSSAHDLYSVR